MTPNRRLLAGAIGLALAFAACGGSTTATGAPGATAAAATTAPSAATTGPSAAAPTASEAPAPTDAPTATDGTSTGAQPSLAPGAASDLEAMLPSEAGGVTYQKTSFDGSSLGALGASIDTAQLDPILKANGKTINDVRVAIAAPVDSANTEAGMVVAFQIRGLDASKFIQAMGSDVSTMTKTSLGGKDVYSAGAGGMSAIVYPKDDVLFEVLLASDKVAEAIVSQLP